MTSYDDVRRTVGCIQLIVGGGAGAAFLLVALVVQGWPPAWASILCGCLGVFAIVAGEVTKALAR